MQSKASISLRFELFEQSNIALRMLKFFFMLSYDLNNSLTNFVFL